MEESKVTGSKGCWDSSNPDASSFFYYVPQQAMWAKDYGLEPLMVSQNSSIL